MVEVALKKAKLTSGVDVFYREAGSPQKPTILLLHGFPNSSFYFRNLIPVLAPSFHVIAPDLAGFGFTTVPAGYVHTFENMGKTVASFVESVIPAQKKFSMYVFDYGAPAGLRMALKIPDRVEAIITQNGNAFEVGLGPAWEVVRKYWNDPSPENRQIVRENVLGAESIKGQYLYGVPSQLQPVVAPEAYTLDAALTAGANAEVQLNLILDYAKNVAMYPEFQAYLKEYKPRVLAVWGKNDPFFVPAGAEAWLGQGLEGEVHLIDTGHFALETSWVEIARRIGGFLQD